MATRTHITLIDDLDETEAADTISFAYQGVTYEIDLSEANIEKLDKALSPYIQAGRRTGGKARASSAPRDIKSGSKRGPRQNGEAAKIRLWAAQQNPPIAVNLKGRIPQEIREQWQRATGGSLSAVG